ncbi:MAG: PEP-CTERM sorting domain-containing protein [Nitrospiraceae bacterium]|nr:PEP-CTERM sorting domain-containing protein [Nitrospiraceae bacterium]
MKKILVAVVMGMVMLAASSVAFADGIQMYYTLPTGTTGIFDRQVLSTVDATSTYANGIVPLSTFNDVGDLQIGAFTLHGTTIGSTAGLNTAWEMTGRWDNLKGYISGASAGIDVNGNAFNALTIKYTSGTASLYAGLASNGTKNANFGLGIGAGDDVASTFTDGIKLADIKLFSGNGSLVNFANPAIRDTGSTFTTWRIVDVPTGVWFDALGNDMEALLEAYGYVDVNTIIAANVTIITGPNGSQILTRNTGDANYGVPEPSTILLLGAGLFGLGLYARKRMS